MHRLVAGPRRISLAAAAVLALAASIPAPLVAPSLAGASRPLGPTPVLPADSTQAAAARTTADHLRTTAATPVATPVSAPVAAPTPASRAAATVGPEPASKPVAAPVYRGTNHVWIPALGISHAVAAFACDRSTPPGAGVYRWGCAGTDNAYLFGHAWSTFKPLHDAYVAGRLHTGLVVWYADASGRVHRYVATAIRVVTPDQTGWAIAAQAVPSMTLQTCVGANSQYRLLVRLVRVA